MGTSTKADTATPVQLVEGQPAPDFSVQDDQGRTVRLKELRGKTIVLYFYPKDDTPGCTKEACAFRDGIAEIRKKGAEVFGVSADSVASHQKFREKYQLSFPLLADVDKTVSRAYGVWKKKSLYGRWFDGIERTTFVIAPDGRLKKIFPKVKVDQHYDEVLAAI